MYSVYFVSAAAGNRGDRVVQRGDLKRLVAHLLLAPHLSRLLLAPHLNLKCVKTPYSKVPQLVE